MFCKAKEHLLRSAPCPVLFACPVPKQVFGGIRSALFQFKNIHIVQQHFCVRDRAQLGRAAAPFLDLKNMRINTPDNDRLVFPIHLWVHHSNIDMYVRVGLVQFLDLAFNTVQRSHSFLTVYTVVSALVLGTGMCLCLVWGQIIWGTLVGLLGIIMLIALIPMIKGIR